MEVLIGKFLAQMYQKLKEKETILLGNVTMTLTDMLDKSAQHSQFSLCIENGEVLISFSKWPSRLLREA